MRPESAGSLRYRTSASPARPKLTKPVTRAQTIGYCLATQNQFPGVSLMNKAARRFQRKNGFLFPLQRLQTWTALVRITAAGVSARICRMFLKNDASQARFTLYCMKERTVC